LGAWVALTALAFAVASPLVSASSAAPGPVTNVAIRAPSSGAVVVSGTMPPGDDVVQARLSIFDAQGTEIGRYYALGSGGTEISFSFPLPAGAATISIVALDSEGTAGPEAHVPIGPIDTMTEVRSASGEAFPPAPLLGAAFVLGTALACVAVCYAKVRSPARSA
jgi:hypothetical protein